MSLPLSKLSNTEKPAAPAIIAGSARRAVVLQEESVPRRLPGDLLRHHQAGGDLQPRMKVLRLPVDRCAPAIQSRAVTAQRKCSTSMMSLPSSSNCGKTRHLPSGVSGHAVVADAPRRREARRVQTRFVRNRKTAIPPAG